MSARELHLHIEGDLRLRAGFSQLFKKELGELCQKHKVILRVMMGGSNSDTFHRCRRTPPAGVHCVLLIDADAPVEDGMEAREHLRRLHGWNDLRSLQDKQVHLMVIEMEAWLVCDLEAWKRVFGTKFRSEALPKAHNVEIVGKKSLADAIERATRDTPSGPYRKGSHDVRLLEELSPARIVDRAPRARLFFAELRRQIAS